MAPTPLQKPTCQRCGTVLISTRNGCLQGSDENDFVEVGLNAWKETLGKLTDGIAASQTIIFRRNDGVTPSICASFNDKFNYLFEQLSGDIEIEDSNQVIVHGPTQKAGAVCSRMEYSSGQHRFRLKLEQFYSSEWFSIGIAPKNSSVLRNLHHGPTIYNKIERHGAFFNGATIQPYNSHDYTLELFVDCDRHTIYLTNERTPNITQKLEVDLTKCPFPWQFSVVLYKPGDRVRILST